MRIHLSAAIVASALAMPLILPAPALAQSNVEGRVDRLEGEMRAVQRKVFPGGGGGQYVQPEITPRDANTDFPGTPGSSPVADLNARVDALESQMRTLTGQIETLQHDQQLSTNAMAAQKRTVDARLKALEDGASSAGSSAPSRGESVIEPAAPTRPASIKPPTRPVPDKPGPDKTGTTKTGATSTTKDPERAAKVAALEKPATDDPVEDGYSFGYRLWIAKFYPEAEAQLKSVVTANPKHRRASYAQNLLGRAYLDEGKPSLASLAFYDNYKRLPDGERAPDSLLYLADALSKAGKSPAEVCKVYDELNDVYGATIKKRAAADPKDDLRPRIIAGRARMKCG